MEEIFIPATGMAMEEAELLQWLKQPGDTIAVGDPIATIETDKVTVDIEAETAGVLDAHLVTAGTLVAAGVVITRVLQPGETATAAPDATEPTAPTVPDPAVPEPAAPEPTVQPVAEPVAEPTPAPATVDSVSPNARRPHTLTPRQRREKREREAAAAAGSVPAQPAAAAAPAPERGSDRSSTAVARAVSDSWSTIPHFAVSREIDVTGLFTYLADIRATGLKASLTDLLLQAAARSWATVRPGGTGGVGLSVASPKRVINVSVADAASGDLASLVQRRQVAVERARAGLLKPDDFAPVLVTVSNLGTHGVDWFTGIIPMGQHALFTIGRARNVAQLVDGTLSNRRMMWVTANLDHRELDGADGAHLLEAFAVACSITLNDPSDPRSAGKA